MMKRTMLVVGAFGLVLGGCDRQEDEAKPEAPMAVEEEAQPGAGEVGENPASEVVPEPVRPTPGQRLDSAIEKTGRGLKNAGEKTEEALRKAGESSEDAYEQAKEKTEEGLRKAAESTGKALQDFGEKLEQKAREAEGETGEETGGEAGSAR